MLTVKKLSLGQASTYYSKDNYYTQERGEYFGKLKDELGLDDLTHESFVQLLNGTNPSTGEALVASKKNKKSNVPAFDFTFSPSKSVSIAYELAVAKGDKTLANSILKIHDNAVNSALTHIEEEQIKVRVQKNGKRVSVCSGNMIAAKFEHNINRNLEPQLHTHSVIYNFTKGEDGKFRSVDASKFLKKGSPIIKSLGQFYREALKNELESAGFGLRDVDRDKSFYELKSVDDSLIKGFSSRSQDIKLKIEELKKEFPKLSHAQLSERAFFNTRVTKKEVNRDEVREKNIELMAKYCDVDKLLSDIQPTGTQPTLKKVDEVELKKLIRECQQELKRWQRDPLNVSSEVLKKLPKNANLKMDEIFSKVKEQQGEEKQSLNTMHEVLVLNLKQTKLDTQKLYSNLYSLKSLNKHQIEEKIENGRRSNRDYTLKRDDISTTIDSRAEQAYAGDDELINRDFGTSRERGESRGDELERLDDVESRKSRENDSKFRVTITKEDIELAERAYRERQNQNDKGISDD